MAIMAAAMLLVPLLDALAKLLTATLSPGQIGLGRFAVQTVVLGAVVLVRRRGLRSRPVPLHLLGGALLAGALVLLIWALAHLPLANAIAIFFVEPLILTLLSALVLGERVGPRRLLGCAAGFVGALVVIRPNWAAFGWASVLPLAAALCFAGYLTVTRHLAVTADRLEMLLWMGGGGTVVLVALTLLGHAADVALLALAWPDRHESTLLVGIGVLSAATHLMVAHAFGRAPASILAPFQYLEIISATALGVLLFGDFPDALTWIGTAVIVGSGLYVFHRERRLARAR
jgi:drug/metabolite transporter (DMT)-like permease